jgi:hypothetical protein
MPQVESRGHTLAQLRGAVSQNASRVATIAFFKSDRPSEHAADDSYGDESRVAVSALASPFCFRLLVPRGGVKRGLMFWVAAAGWWCVGALGSGGVSADAQAYFGTRLGLAPGRRHDV